MRPHSAAQEKADHEKLLARCALNTEADLLTKKKVAGAQTERATLPNRHRFFHQHQAVVGMIAELSNIADSLLDNKANLAMRNVLTLSMALMMQRLKFTYFKKKRRQY